MAAVAASRGLAKDFGRLRDALDVLQRGSPGSGDREGRRGGAARGGEAARGARARLRRAVAELEEEEAAAAEEEELAR
jgi:hypothetical protein